MEEAPFQILEIRAAEGERPVTVTAAITADGTRAVFSALSEELDRRRREPITGADDVLALREHVALVDRIELPASARSHAIVRFSAADLRACLLALTAFRDRVGGEHFQAADLRARLELIDQITPVLWDANTAAAAMEAPAEAATN